MFHDIEILEDEIPVPRFDGDCRGLPTTWWFPERGEANTGTRKAVEICKTCPVLIECGEFANSYPKLHGIWGATTLRQRQRRRNQSK